MTEGDLLLTKVSSRDLPQHDARHWWHRVDGLGDGLVVYLLIEMGEPGVAIKPTIKCVQVMGEPSVRTEDLRSIPLGRIERLLRSNDGTLTYTIRSDGSSGWYLREPPQLTRRRADESAEQFARRVAEVYRWHVTRTGKPAVAMAEDSGAPVGTVRRWIREARQLGALESGTRGKAG